MKNQQKIQEQKVNNISGTSNFQEDLPQLGKRHVVIVILFQTTSYVMSTLMSILRVQMELH